MRAVAPHRGNALDKGRHCRETTVLPKSHPSALPSLPTASLKAGAAQAEGKSPYLRLHVLAANQEQSAAQIPADFQEGGEILPPGAGGTSGHTAGGSSPSLSCICSLKKRKHPKNDQNWGDSFTAPKLNESLSVNTCARSKEKPVFAQPGHSQLAVRHIH